MLSKSTRRSSLREHSENRPFLGLEPSRLKSKEGEVSFFFLRTEKRTSSILYSYIGWWVRDVDVFFLEKDQWKVVDHLGGRGGGTSVSREFKGKWSMVTIYVTKLDVPRTYLITSLRRRKRERGSDPTPTPLTPFSICILRYFKFRGHPYVSILVESRDASPWKVSPNAVSGRKLRECGHRPPHRTPSWPTLVYVDLVVLPEGCSVAVPVLKSLKCWRTRTPRGTWRTTVDAGPYGRGTRGSGFRSPKTL